MLAKLSIVDFANEVASSKSVMPAGGCVTALSGLMGVCLIEMAIRSSYGYAADKEFFDKTQVQMAYLHSQLLNYIDEDAEAYNRVIAACKLKRTTLSEEEQRRAVIQSAALEATEVPLQIGNACVVALEVGTRLLTMVKPSVIGDLKVGLLVSKAGIEGALTASRLNLSLVNENSKCVLESRIDELQQKLDNLVD
ncbi:cyclodeaminase/cyclohydrolase family protein [Sporomusa sp.]|uniref:cyclodeaminase/cyclohydrolase family protein n=1 Tax=Sporomusa sp. TaxID=2078658 RepID=UPI002C802DAE|nr:cyclodeaminase/cyclohydrolase family protein [Sporomusa sp.]HWR44898.1 cyclodeaminase/cyclohydrolase family protein [Sporomusa sp.]